MEIELNKYSNLGQLSKAQVDGNWTALEGALESATGAQITQMATDKMVTPENISDALAWVTLTYGSTIAIDGSTFNQGVVTLTGGAELGNPTNFAIGTKYVMVKGDSATLRALTFGSAYKGALPTLNDISDTKWYLLSLVAYASDHIVVSAVRAL